IKESFSTNNASMKEIEMEVSKKSNIIGYSETVKKAEEKLDKTEPSMKPTKSEPTLTKTIDVTKADNIVTKVSNPSVNKDQLVVINNTNVDKRASTPKSKSKSKSKSIQVP
ncbi:hypothetical protein B9K06_26090, partial [Bacillus sp. OG2]